MDVERCVIGDSEPEESVDAWLSCLDGIGNVGLCELDLDKDWGADGGVRDAFSYMGAGWRVGAGAGCVDWRTGGGG